MLSDGKPGGFMSCRSPPPTRLALQLLFCFEVSPLSGSLVSSAPARPCDDVCGLNALSSESDGNAADFLD